MGGGKRKRELLAVLQAGAVRTGINAAGVVGAFQPCGRHEAWSSLRRAQAPTPPAVVQSANHPLSPCPLRAAGACRLRLS